MIKEERIQLRDKLINEYKQKYKALMSNKIKEMFKNDKRYELYIQQFRSEIEALYCIVHQDDFENHKCPICNKLSVFYANGSNKNYKVTCGNSKCIEALANSDEAKEKGIQTNLRKRKVKNAAQSEEVKNKIKETNMKIRGVPYSLQSKEVREKRDETMERLYGTKHALQVEEFKNQLKQTCLNEYGADNVMKLEEFIKKQNESVFKNLGVYHPLQSKEVRKKLENTNLKNLGVKHSTQSEIVKEKIRNTNLRERGVPYATQSEEVKKKIRNTKIKNNIPENFLTNQELVKFLNKFNKIYNQNIQIQDLYSNNEYFIKFIKYLYKNKKRLLRLKEIADIFGFNSNAIKRRIEEIKILDYFYIIDSNLEIQFKNFLDKNNIQYERKNRKLRNDKNGYPFELDFVLKNYNITFEINDIKSHNLLLKNKDYHINKTIKAKNDLNLKLIHLWEWELTDEDLWRRTSNWILNLLNDSKIQIDIKDCAIKKLVSKKKKNF